MGESDSTFNIYIGIGIAGAIVCSLYSLWLSCVTRNNRRILTTPFLQDEQPPSQNWIRLSSSLHAISEEEADLENTLSSARQE
jgi:hypothetical protein